MSSTIPEAGDDGQELIPLRDRIKTFEGVIKERAPLKEPQHPETYKLLTNFGAAMPEIRGIALQNQAFMRQAYGIEVPLPTLPVAGLDVACLPYEEAYREVMLRHDAAVRDVARMLQCNRVGRVTWADRDKVRFDYVDVIDEMGILRWQRHRIRHTHELVKAVSHPLDEPSVPRDGRTHELIAIVPPAWRSYARIITGLEILREQDHDGTDESFTGFGRLVHGTGQAAGTAARSAGQALARIDPKTAAMVAAGVGLAGLGAAALCWLASAAAVVIADPCLAIGEYCLHGWE